MVWLKLDDQFLDHPKIKALTDRALRLHLEGMLHCARNLTDGWVPADAVALSRVKVQAAPRHLDELVQGELWSPATPDGYIVHDYLDYNPSKELVQARRRANADRQKAWRDKRADGPQLPPLPPPPPPEPNGNGGVGLDIDRILRDMTDDEGE